MCGGHVVHMLAHPLGHEPISQHKDTAIDVRQEIKLLYARGEIDSGAFHRLLEMADSGLLTSGDLARVGQAARDHSGDSRAGTRDEIATLEIQIARLYKQAKDAEWNAGRVSPDGDQARAYLETKQGALFRAHEIEARVAALKGGA